ncbi:DUF7695 domain-containing protein [Paenibacillus gyeongsangnamensis]
MRKIIKNVIRCLSCNDTIESKSTHDYQKCSCGEVSVDGGKDYLKRTYPHGNPARWYEELSEWKSE